MEFERRISILPVVRVCSVSVDLDSLACYYQIHGLGTVPEQLERVVIERALPRFLELFARHKIRATLFVVGSDVERNVKARTHLQDAAQAGHELGNHSFSHFYDLCQRSPDLIAQEVLQAHKIIQELQGKPPVGFRSPGYDLSTPLVDVLADLGYRYDSSVFPSWPYYMAKLGVIHWMRVRGRRSASVIGDGRVLGAPLEPYRMGHHPFTRGQGPVVELPVTVSSGLRFPVIGTFLLTMPAWLRRNLLHSIRRRTFFNFELHGIEMLDAERDELPAELVAKQPDLRVSLEKKQRIFDAILDGLAGDDYVFWPLAEVATQVQRKGLEAHA